MTRGGSQDDPQQLLRDLQDSLEREADLREQLRFAEEEVKIPIKQKSFYDFSSSGDFILSPSHSVILYQK